MKKKKGLMIFSLLMMGMLIISTYSIFYFRSEMLGYKYKGLYEPLENNINVIKENMDDITISNDEFNWYKLKKLDISDKKLKDTYNLLVADIRTCYLLETDLKNKIYDNLKILSFKNKKDISKEELLELSNNDCLNNFNKYNSLVLSDDENISERVKTQIGIIINEEKEDIVYDNFYSVLYNDLVTMTKIMNVSKWLKAEYYGQKDMENNKE